MREAKRRSSFTDFGLWIKDELREDMSVTDIDYVFSDYKKERFMLVEEKCKLSKIEKGQAHVFERINDIFNCKQNINGQKYHGFYVIQFPQTLPTDDGTLLNGYHVNIKQLIDHLNFTIKHCDRIDFNKIKAEHRNCFV